MVFLHLDGSGHTLPEAGTELLLEDRVVGRVTSVARHYEDGPIALGVVKRNADPEAVLVAGSTSAAQTVIVAPDRPKSPPRRQLLQKQQPPPPPSQPPPPPPPDAP